MDFKILDASAFYAGVPFSSLEEYYTTPLVYDEIKHIKRKQGILEILLETSRLKIREPDEDATKSAIRASKDTGDFQQLSKQDISIIALGIELKGHIISDDFAIGNIAKNLGLRISPIMTRGIKDVGKWIHYCPVCKTNHTVRKQCPACGTLLKRKLLKNKSFNSNK